MHLRIRTLRRDEGGFSVATTLGAILVITALVTVSLAAANGDLRLTRRDLDTKRAYAAAQAGVIDYAFHLNDFANYWTRCTNVPAPNALNQVGSTAQRRAVPGSTDGSQYAIELLPATTYTGTPTQCNPTNPAASMLEQSGANAGTFRIRSNGYAGNARRSIVASFKQASFLDYVYFTQLETSDPVTYGFANPSTQLDAAYDQCTKFRRDGRPRAGSTTPSQICDTIVFVSGDDIEGPMHTNDDFCVATGSSPTFGRSAADPIEVSASPPGWHSSTSTGNGCTGSNASPDFVGPLVPNSPILIPKANNMDELRTIAGAYVYTGQTRVTLDGGNMRINGGPLQPIPTGGAIYIANGSCSTSYSPFTATYPATSGCGNAIVHSSNPYTVPVTIAAENDIVIDGSIQRASNASGLLGLVASNFIRIKHVLCPSTNTGCDGSTSTQTAKGTCNGGVNSTNPSNPPLNNIEIDAANLAIDHSFIVDHYDCGPNLGTLNMTGAIAQKFRGAVGTSGGTGYTKNYVYDDRLRFEEPPQGFDPSNASWHVQRETLDFP